MSKKKTHERDVDECVDKIIILLEEYGCDLTYDKVSDTIDLVDKNTSQYQPIQPNKRYPT